MNTEESTMDAAIAVELPAQELTAAVESVEPIARMTVEGLSAWYGRKQALDSVGLSIEDRRITALIGPSGCGKSTFLRTLNRLNDTVRGFKATGSVRLGDTEVLDSAVDVVRLRRTVGMVFQQPNPFPMTIFDNIALGIREHEPRISHKVLKERVEESLARAGLLDEVKDGLMKHSALSLSGGQQQRLCIARALAIRPSVLLLDEPCASLDPISTARIEELLIELKRDFTIVIVTHNLPQARRIADATAFFLMGRLVESGSTERMATSPLQAETREYFAGAFG